MQPLKPGDKVGIVTPSSFLPSKEAFQLGIDYLESLGFEVVLGKHVFDQFRYMGGTDQDRAEDLNNFYRDPSIKAIFSSKGGSGSQRILPYLDYEVIKNNPKPLFGFSDVTAVQLGIYAKTQAPVVTGFTLMYDFKSGHIDGLVDSTLKTILNGEKVIVQSGKTIIGGVAEGKLIGGCLSLIRNLCGTDYYPDLTDAILLIEDVAEKTYKIDLMLQQLQQNPNFSKIKGIVFGEFADTMVSDPEDGTIDETIAEFCKDLSIPVIKDFPYGHVPSRAVLPIGEKVRLDANNCRLEYL